MTEDASEVTEPAPSPHYKRTKWLGRMKKAANMGKKFGEKAIIVFEKSQDFLGRYQPEPMFPVDNEHGGKKKQTKERSLERGFS